MNEVFFSVSLILHRYDHGHNYYTDPHLGSASHFLTHIEQGSCKFITEHSTLEVEAGDYLYIPKGLVYHSHWHSDSQVLFKSFSFSYFPECDTRQYLLQRIEHGEAIKAVMEDFPTVQPPDSGCIGRFFCALAEILPHLKYDITSKKKIIIEKARGYIINNEMCSVSQIAKHCLVSESTLYDIFKKETGSTPNEFRQKLLCEKAAYLLSSTDLSVQEISNSLNFSSTSYFRKVLRKHTGKTPRQLRHSLKSI